MFGILCRWFGHSWRISDWVFQPERYHNWRRSMICWRCGDTVDQSCRADNKPC